MKCETVQQNIVLVAYGELPDEDLASLEQHLGGCEQCNKELQALLAMHEAISETDPVAELSPNLVARARLKLDEELDALPPHALLTRLQSNFWNWMAHIHAAPALMTLLVGTGFLAGNFTHRYQVAHQPQLPTLVRLSNPAKSGIANINRIVQTPNSEIVQVSYNRIVPETMQGSLDDPQIRELLVIGTRAAADNAVRTDSVELLANECRAGHDCLGEPGSAIRAALISTLRSDKSPAVRLQALEGLQRYVAEDQRVRDAVLEALMHDSSASVRTRAVSLLAPVESDSSVRQVMRTVSTSDENQYIRTVSTRALAGTADIQ